MTTNQARALAQRGKMVRSMREVDAYMHPFTVKYEPPPPMLQTNGLVCHHCRLAWDACKPCNRTKENALLQTKELRERLGITS